MPDGAQPCPQLSFGQYIDLIIEALISLVRWRKGKYKV